MLIARLLNRAIKTGSLTMIDAGNRAHRFCDGNPPSTTIQLHDRWLRVDVLSSRESLIFVPDIQQIHAYIWHMLPRIS